VELRWKRPEHSWWSAGCLAGLVIATVVAGFSLPLVGLFVVIFGAGAALISLDGGGVPPVADVREGETIGADTQPADEESSVGADDTGNVTDYGDEAADEAVDEDETVDEDDAQGEDAAPGVRPSGDASPT